MTKKLSNFQRFYLKNRLFINFAILLALFFVHCFWGYTMYIVYPLLLLMIIFDNIRNGFSYIVFTVPFCMLNVYISSLLFCLCILIYICKFYWILYITEKNKPNIPLVVTLGVFLVYCLLPIGKYNVNLLLKFSMLFFMFACIGMVIKKPNVIRLGFNVRVLAIALLISSAFAATYFISPYMKDITPLMFATANGKFVRFQALLQQPNVLAMICEILLSVLAYFIISGQASWKDYAFFVVLSVLGLSTFSKTFLILLCVIYFSVFVGMLIKHPIKTLIITCILVGIVAIIGVFNTKLVMVFYNRFMGSFKHCNNFVDFLSMITTGRSWLWFSYVNYLGKNPLALIFGRGLGAPVLSSLDSSMQFSAHNAFISMIYQIGLVGFLLLIAVAVLMILEFKRNNKTKLHKAIFVPIIVIFLILLVEDMVFYIFPMM